MPSEAPAVCSGSSPLDRLCIRYALSPAPAKTPIVPAYCSGAQPARSSASWHSSRKIRCCGSVISASRADMPKSGASNWSIASRTGFALT